MIERDPENYAKFPLDQHIFDQLDDFVTGVRDKEKQRVLEECLMLGKIKAFSLAEQALDFLLVEGAEKLKDKNDFYRSDQLHDVLNSFAAIGLTLGSLKVRLDWPVDEEKKKLVMEKVAISYAFNLLKKYQMAVQTEQDKEKILKELKLPDSIGLQYIEEHFLKKIGQLPSALKENLMEVT